MNFNNHIEKYKNKWIELEFIPDINEIGQNIYPNTFKVVIKFEEFSKFGLNGFNPDIKFRLNSAKFVYPQTLTEYANINIQHLNDFSFRYHFDYEDNLINQHIKNDQNNTNSTNTNLLSNSLNLTKNDLINLTTDAAQNSKSNDTILYSEQNFYALSRYFTFVHNNALSHKLQTINMVDEQNNKINYQIIQGREILRNTLWNINQNYNKAEISKNLDSYKNWENIEDKMVVNINFKMDLFKNLLKDVKQLGFSIDNKSVLTASFMYKDLKNINNNDFLTPTIDFDTEFTEHYQNINNFKALLFNYSFKIQKINNKEFKLIVEAKNNNAFLIDDLSLHYFANKKTALLSEAYMSISYPKKDNESINISFNSVPFKDNTPSYATNKLILDPKRTNNNLEDLNYDTFLSNKREDTARRLWKEDNQAGGLNALRQRVFSFNDATSASVSVLGPVLDDPNDYRFYVVTNTHVSRGWADSSKQGLDTNIEKTINANFRIPNVITKPTNYDNEGYTGPFGSELYWKTRFDVDLDLVSNYRDSDQFWNFNNVKDGYNNKVISYLDNAQARFDMSILIVDLSQFFLTYANNSQKYQDLPEDQKKIADYILNWKKLKLIKASREAFHINDYVNLNWFFGGFPVDSGHNNLDEISGGQRYREYIYGNSAPIIRQTHGTTNVSNSAISFSTRVIDSTGGASGSSVFDSQGNLAALYTAASAGYGYAYIFNGNKWDFYGNGTKPFNRASFYEKMRLLAYLYPERYNQKDFEEKGFKFL
ncbi:hypothetical protein [Mycoplasma miroungirhinis]|uniref:DUF31 domain-containing protein n=1 Tax=Mycoplasma miroungirhinis TaxID=754516 RepID=A0A6M4JAX8_9MOLU|nr:hypothetical protein [Mycoplasma miroungirhinis]QJR44060.1 hypothetical protein HLA92_01235 [Mycoplasma miroungirhinis]